MPLNDQEFDSIVGQESPSSVEIMFKQAHELMRKVERIYDSNPDTINNQIESQKILNAMEDLELLITDPDGYRLR